MSAQTKRKPPLTDQDPQKLSKLDKHILTATKCLEHPTKASIAKQVVELGGAKHIQTVYKRLTLKDFRTRDIMELRDYADQVLFREFVPKVHKSVRKVYNDKNVSAELRYKYDHMIWKSVYGEKTTSGREQTINIGQLENAQFVIGGQLSKDEPEST